MKKPRGLRVLVISEIAVMLVVLGTAFGSYLGMSDNPKVGTTAISLTVALLGAMLFPGILAGPWGVGAVIARSAVGYMQWMALSMVASFPCVAAVTGIIALGTLQIPQRLMETTLNTGIVSMLVALSACFMLVAFVEAISYTRETQTSKKIVWLTQCLSFIAVFVPLHLIFSKEGMIHPLW